MSEITRQREIATGVLFSTRNRPVAGVTEVVGSPAVDGYGRPLPPKFPALLGRVSAPIAADEATTEAIEEANHED